MTPNSHSRLVVLEEIDEGALEKRLVLDVPADLPVFEAHFPGDAILPAYVEVREVVQQSRRAWPELGDWQGATGIKFKAPIRPGMRLELSLRRDAAAPRVSFTLRQDEQVCAQGNLRFAPQDASG